MSTDNYWVGLRTDTGLTLLYDPSIQHDDPNMVYAYRVDQGEMREYRKDAMRSMLTTVKDPSRMVAVKKYVEWYAKYGAAFLETDRKRKESEAEQRRQRAIERHREYLLANGKEYGGVVRDSFKRSRVTHCYSCKEKLDSSLLLECSSCGWLICYCGACGCAYKALA